MTHYLIYKITNKLNGKFYIGKHETENVDDGYMGSGKALLEDYEKFGKENFTKEILFDVYGRDMMDFLERAIVDKAFVARDDTYNIARGGQGGHLVDFSEEIKQRLSKARRSRTITEETKRKISKALKGKSRTFTEEHKRHLTEANRRKPPFLGHHHSEETRAKMSKTHKSLTLSEETKRKISEAKKRYWDNVHNQKHTI